MWQDIDYSLTSKGVTVSGGTNDRAKLEAFIAALQKLLPMLPPPPAK